MIFRLNLKRESKNYKNFINDNTFSNNPDCKNKDLISIKELLNDYSDFRYLRKKYVETAQARGEKIKQLQEWEKDVSKLIVTKNRYKPDDDKLFYFRNILSNQDKEQIKITNYLLNQIQDLTEKNNSKFILLHVLNKNYYFKKNKDYSICLKGKIVSYSNKNFEELITNVFKGIKNIVNYEIKRNTKEYDIYDGHLNYNMNQEIFKKVSEKIQSDD